MEKPTILIFTTSYLPFIGGAEVAIEEITRRLKDRFNFCIVTARLSRDLPKSEIREGITIMRFGFGARLDRWLLPLVVIRYLRSRASIVLGVDIGQGALAAALLKYLRPSIRFILNIQYGGSDKDLSRGYFGLHAFLFRFMLNRADYVTAISTHLENLSEKYGYQGPKAVIPNGVDLNQFKNKNTRTKSINKNSKIIITTSRLVLKNGIDILIKAVAEVKKIIPDIQCWIIGDGPERKNYQLLTASCQLEKNVKFFGALPHAKIPAFLHRADIFVRPSRSEGLGNVFVEALESGLPIIGTKAGGIKDIIEDGKTGLFARMDDPHDLAEKIVRLLRDDNLARLIVENGRRMVEEKFSWEDIASSYGHLFFTFTPPLKIMIATGLFPPEMGGPATYSKLLREELPKHGISVEVLAFSEVRHLPKIVRHFAYFLKVLRRGSRADVIFAQDPVSVGLPSAMAAGLLRKKFLLKIAGDYAWEQGAQRWGVQELLDDFIGKKYGPGIEFLRRVERFVAGRADFIIVPSEYLKGVIIRWGVAPGSIKVIYNSFHASQEPASKNEARKNLKLSGKIILSAGRLVPWKGFATLIGIMPQVLQNMPEAKLVIIGSGPDEQKLKHKIAELRLGDHVKIIDQVPRQTLLGYLRAADAFVLNTGYEGLSHILLEAMAMGTPIITTDVGGNPELIRNGVAGLLVGYDSKRELKQALIKVLTNQELTRGLGEGAKRELHKFGKEEMIAITAKIIKNL